MEFGQKNAGSGYIFNSLFMVPRLQSSLANSYQSFRYIYSWMKFSTLIASVLIFEQTSGLENDNLKTLFLKISTSSVVP
jgi:hypothetical protein